MPDKAKKKTSEEIKKNGMSVSWEAEEYITHDKNAGWYIGSGIVCLGLNSGFLLR